MQQQYINHKQPNHHQCSYQLIEQHIPLDNLNQYTLYKQQNQTNGVFHMRFQQILNSPINQTAFTQLRLAASFQIKKTFTGLFKSKPKHNLPQIYKPDTLKAGPNQIKMVWIGHASVLLSIQGHTHILIDPIFSSKLVNLFNIVQVGQKRLIQPACKIQQLPPIDFVLVSHDHLDHCNDTSIDKIYQKFGNKTWFIAGKNSRQLFPPQSKFKQMSWTQSIKFKNKHDPTKNIKITFVPACHWSKRSLAQQNNRLWGGFVIQVLNKKIYFAGDTGYCGIFKQLNKQFGGFDLSLLPIGAYEPNQYLKPQHINPKQAVRVHNEIKSKVSVGIHWGTFPMSYQSSQQVLQDFSEAQKDVEAGSKFEIVNIGGGVTLYCKENNIFNKQKFQKIQIKEQQRKYEFFGQIKKQYFK